MDPIQRRNNITPPSTSAAGPVKPARTESADAAKALFSLTGPRTEAAARTGATSSAALETMRSRIRDAADRHGADKAGVLHDVVGEYSREMFGKDTPADLTDRITEAFVNDPYLASVFNRLYHDATRSG
jgi:hypothetical protein